jgi:hypothetical protein
VRAGGLAWQARKQDIMNITELAHVYVCTRGNYCHHFGWIGAIVIGVLVVGIMAYQWWRKRRS